jgi:protein gp37
MGDGSAIQWTDATWNPVTGCSKVSPGCANCYAETLTRRFSGTWGVPDLPWTPENAAENVILHPERLKIPLKWQRPRMVFVNSMSDLFHELVPVEFIFEVFKVMAEARQHTFQVLTKRPERMSRVIAQLASAPVWRPTPNGSFEWPLPNVWLGTSIENRKFVGRADALRATPAAVRFISAEPLLGPLIGSPVRLGDGRVVNGWPSATEGAYIPGLDLTDIDWLIVGGESGPGHRPMQAQWVRDLRQASLLENLHRDPNGLDDAGPKFFFKQWGGVTPKAGGRELDGCTWDEMPQVVSDGPLTLI